MSETVGTGSRAVGFLDASDAASLENGDGVGIWPIAKVCVSVSFLPLLLCARLFLCPAFARIPIVPLSRTYCFRLSMDVGMLMGVLMSVLRAGHFRTAKGSHGCPPILRTCTLRNNRNVALLRNLMPHDVGWSARRMLECAFLQ